MIEIHPSAKISRLADIEDSIRKTKIVICEQVVIDSFVKIKPAGGTGDIFIGNNTTINSGCVLYTGNGIKIGAFVAIASNCTLAPVNHRYNDKGNLIARQGFGTNKGGITIGDDVWIGANSVLLDGSIIPTGCVIGAGSIVRGILEEYGVYAGHPLRKIKHRQ